MIGIYIILAVFLIIIIMLPVAKNKGAFDKKVLLLKNSTNNQERIIYTEFNWYVFSLLLAPIGLIIYMPDIIKKKQFRIVFLNQMIYFIISLIYIYFAYTFRLENAIFIVLLIWTIPSIFIGLKSNVGTLSWYLNNGYAILDSNSNEAILKTAELDHIYRHRRDNPVIVDELDTAMIKYIEKAKRYKRTVFMPFI